MNPHPPVGEPLAPVLRKRVRSNATFEHPLRRGRAEGTSRRSRLDALVSTTSRADRLVRGDVIGYNPHPQQGSGVVQPDSPGAPALRGGVPLGVRWIKAYSFHGLT